jgi:hypothetical protein
MVQYKSRTRPDIGCTYFDVERSFRKSEEIVSKLLCRIQGIVRNWKTYQPRTEPYRDDGKRWVNVDGCEYRLEKQEIHDWLSNFWKLSLTTMKTNLKWGTITTEMIVL